MTEELDNIILKILREMRSDMSTLRDDVGVIKNRTSIIENRLGEIHETLYQSAGLAMHANVRQNTFLEEFTNLQKRVKKLEEKVQVLT